MSNVDILDLPYDELNKLSKDKLIMNVNLYRRQSSNHYCKLRNIELMMDLLESKLRRLQVCILEGKSQNELVKIVNESWEEKKVVS